MLALALLLTRAEAAALVLPDAPPQKVEDVQTMVAPGGPIRQTLDAAMCGGWNTSESLKYSNPTSTGKIPKVGGVPGHLSNALGEPLSGMGKRIETGGAKSDGFLFPNGATGLTTACRPDKPATRVRIQQFTGILVKVSYPQFSDPLCGTFNGAMHSPKSPSVCKDAHAYLNNEDDFTWLDCFKPDIQVDPDTGAVTIDCTNGLRKKWVCSDQWVDEPFGRNSEECTGSECRCPGPNCKLAPNGNQYLSYFRRYKATSERDRIQEVSTDKLAFTGSTRVAIDCTKQTKSLLKAQKDLASEQAALKNVQNTVKPILDVFKQKSDLLRAVNARIATLIGILTHPHDHTSDELKAASKELGNLWMARAKLAAEVAALLDPMELARHSLLEAEQHVRDAESAVHDAEAALLACQDTNANKMNVACYGFYNEFDPKKKVVVQPDSRCVVDFPFTHDELKVSQAGKGTFLPTNVVDPPQNYRKASFDSATDTWYPNLSDSLSLLTDKGFQQQWGGDLARALLSPDVSTITASTQRSPAAPLSQTSVTRAFDESVAPERGDTRVITQWWQRFETDATRFFSPPSIHLRLPDTWILTPSDLPTETGTPVTRDPRAQAIDVQLKANDDLLGTVAQYLDRSLLLKVEEEPVNVVVPLTSPVELRAYAERWIRWQAERVSIGKPALPQADQLIRRLQQYANDVERERLLRNELSRTLGKVLDQQQNILLDISIWVQQNLTQYKSYLAQRNARLVLKQQWKMAEQMYLLFTEDMNQPWCRNDRFLPEIYSLLTAAFQKTPAQLSSEPPSCSAGNVLPTLCAPLKQQDIVFDLSRLKVMTGSVKLPVLHATQVTLQIPTPGGADWEPDAAFLKTMELPDFPPIPTLSPTMIPSLPTVSLRSAPAVIPPPQTVNLVQANGALIGARTKLMILDILYKQFWDALEPDDSSKGLECTWWGLGKCVQVEMDLLERVGRMFARPEVLLREDLQWQGVPHARTTPTGSMTVTCNPDDLACTQLNGQKQLPGDGWQIIPPKASHDSTAAIDAERQEKRQETVTDDQQISGAVPYGAGPQELLPIFEVPGSTDLRPLPPSASSSST